MVEKRSSEDESSPKPPAKRQRATNGAAKPGSASSKTSSKSKKTGESKAPAKKTKAKASESKGKAATAAKAKKEAPAKKTAGKKSPSESKTKKSSPAADKKTPTKSAPKGKAKGKVATPPWKPVLCASKLEEHQYEMLQGVLGTKKTKLLSEFDSRVTHLVLPAHNETDTPPRTVKLCKAIAAGVPLLCFRWVQEAVGVSNKWPDVKNFVHPLSREPNAPKLFANHQFYFGALGSSREFKADLAEIVRLGGGEVLPRKPEPPIEPARDGDDDEGSTKEDKPASILILVEAPAENSKQAAGRRAPLSTLRDAIPGSRLVHPNWILDQCCEATKKLEEDAVDSGPGAGESIVPDSDEEAEVEGKAESKTKTKAEAKAGSKKGKEKEDDKEAKDKADDDEEMKIGDSDDDVTVECEEDAAERK